MSTEDYADALRTERHEDAADRAEFANLRHVAAVMDRVMDAARDARVAATDVAAAERRVIDAAREWRTVTDIGADYYAAAGRLADAVDALNVRRAS